MAIKKHYFCLIVVLGIYSYAQAEINHWQIINNLSKDSTEQGVIRYKEYVQSLDTKGLIQAAKQCCEEIELLVPPEDWDVAAGKLAFFYIHYPLTKDKPRNITPLFESMENKEENLCWRYSLMQLLGVEWRGRLDVNSSLEIADRMNGIYRDISEPMLLKPKAIRLQSLLLLQAYKENLRKDPAVETFIKEAKGGSKSYIQEARSGKLSLSERTVKINKSTLNRINKSLAEQLDMFSKSETSTAIKEQIVVAWARYRRYDLDSPQISQTMANAINNYKNYDRGLWYLLLKTNIEDFGNQNARNKLQEMISEVKDGDYKKRLTRLDNKLKKAKKR